MSEQPIETLKQNIIIDEENTIEMSKEPIETFIEPIEQPIIIDENNNKIHVEEVKQPIIIDENNNEIHDIEEVKHDEVAKIVKNKMTFKERYDTDPEYKKKHLAYVKEKIPCSCGVMTSRCNMSNHLKSAKHQKKMNNKKTDRTIIELYKIKLDALEEEIELMKRLMKTVDIQS